MTYQVLARKWRPRNFADLAGQSHVVRALSNALNENRLHHAWLFTGTRGVGKTTIARILAKSLNCQQGISAEPCGVCSACTQIDAGRFIDLIELDAASNTGIDNMRDVLDNAQYAPTAGRFKVYIIDEVHMLSKAAFNSMLKTLEEPPEHVKFILATTDPQKIPITVLSRCLQFNLKQMPPDIITQHLERIVLAEAITAETSALQRLARAAQGSMRDALSLLDQAIAFCGNPIQDDIVQGMLGGLDRNSLIQLLIAIATNQSQDLMQQVAALTAQSIDFNNALQELALILHEIALVHLSPETLPDDTPERASIIALANNIDAQTVQLYYQICLLGRRDLPLAPDEAAGFSMTLLRMLAFYPQASSDLITQAAPLNITQAYSTTTPAVARKQHIITTPITASTPKVEALTIQEPPAQGITPILAELPQDTASWAQLVENMKLGGQARMLATECEWHSCQEHRLHLRLAHTHKHLSELAYQSKLKDALTKYFNAPIHLTIELCDAVVESPQLQQASARAQRQADAEATIHADPFIQGLTTQMDATIRHVQPRPKQ